MTKLGQHFLTPTAGGEKIIDEIIDTADLKTDDVVLEVGPGKGILTEALTKKVDKVIAIEKDSGLVEFLKEKFTDTENLKIIHDDILEFNTNEHPSLVAKYKVVANIPYYITSKFLRQFLTAENPPESMILMIQKEVAERIVARNGKESVLSTSVRAYGKPKIIKKVPAGCFSPPPKVDSAIIKISNISKDFFKNEGYPISFKIDEKKFFDLVKKGFSSKRKMLRNNLKLNEKQLKLLKKHGISGQVRAEKLSLDDWKKLYNLLIA
ncbi:MAG: 16S rRNA (adenine(1518)-N(6)/adenine(1519)-N(6))-dimethyltransferase RsmA [Patescibacteria group bacterium]